MLGALGLGNGHVERRLEVAERALRGFELSDGVVLGEPGAEACELCVDDAPALPAGRILDAYEQRAGQRLVRELNGYLGDLEVQPPGGLYLVRQGAKCRLVRLVVPALGREHECFDSGEARCELGVARL